MRRRAHRLLTPVGAGLVLAGLGVLAWALLGPTQPAGPLQPTGSEDPAAAVHAPPTGTAPVLAFPTEGADAPPLAAADLRLLVDAGDDFALLDGLEFFAWLGEHDSAAVAAAQPQPDPADRGADTSSSDWHAQPAPVRAMLSDWQPHWQRLGLAQRLLLLENAALWLRLDSTGQQQLRERLQQWRTLDPSQRARLRLRHDSLTQRPIVEQQRIGLQQQRFAALSPPRQQALRAQYAALPAGQRQAYLLGHQARAVAALAQQVFAFVPPEERRATLQMLHALAPEDRAVLQRLAARMPPWRREQLRTELLQLPAGERSRFLRDATS